MPEQINKEMLALLDDADALYHNAPCGYVSFLANGTIVKINRTLLTWLGYTADEILYQKKFGDFLSKGGQIHYEMFFRPMLNVSGSVKELSYELVKSDGSAFHVLFSAIAIRGESNAVQAVNAIITDNTDRKHYEKEILLAKKLAEGEKKTFQFLADLIPEMIWTAKADGEIDYVNQRFIYYFNLPEKSFSLNVILSKIHSEDRNIFISTWKANVLSGQDLHIELKLLNKHEEYEWHLVKAVPYRNEENQITKWFGSCSNINEHKRALKKKDEFMSIASHELKTPITSLMGTLQLLDRMKNDPSPKMLPNLIERANKNIRKVNSLVGELLNVSQLNEGQLHLTKTTFNIAEMITNSCHHVRTEGIFDVVVKGDEKLKICADESRIEQVLINFVNNAVKYAPNSKQIVISFEPQAEQVKFCVTDKGPGIPLEKLPHLFDRYFRVDSSGSQYSGLGLGLYICAEIIRKHEGRYGVESQLGDGTTFWFTLPC